ncbi:hypothetical protein A3D88_02805 [Candidatus Peribacteria bacterium RIFCSPHIGHO2_02_FULL_52_16]|nr:MAG: hypothetical protein A2706_00630 [Candidatus Peribacteria bacterium RIFCSPHIGHO2_01_FULL_51_35]OGJ61689.1 MAG: hypothetical protein A3D88_02805 [Candidatus Peribacteria bacterium RIFCSPHIGHO2_02_FULL_52_16]
MLSARVHRSGIGLALKYGREIKDKIRRLVNCFCLPPEQLILYTAPPDSNMILTIAHVFRIGMMTTRMGVRRSLVFLLTIGSLFLPTIAQAAIAIDASSPARATGTPPNANALVSASFTPPNSSLLLVMVSADNSQGSNITISVSDSTGLTWTNIVERDKGDAGAEDGHASAWYALQPTSQSMTVSVTRTAGLGGTERISFKVYVITGHDTSDPIGASGENSSTTNNITPTIYTSTVNNSRGFGCATDWNALGLPSSTDTEDAEHDALQISLLSAHKAADTSPSGTAVTMNFDGFGTSAAAWNWVGVEVNPAAGAASPPVKRRRHFFWFIDW